MDSIHKVMQKAFWDIDISCVPGEAFFQGYEAGANYVLEQIEKLIYKKQVKSNLPLFDLTHLIDKLKKK